LNKFDGVERQIGSSMKSVGEVMAIGTTFEEVIQKGLRMIGQGAHGFVGNRDLIIENIREELANPTEMRIFVIEKAFEKGYSVDQVYELTKINRWFLQKLKSIYDMTLKLEKYDRLENVPLELILAAKKKGFSDFQLGRLVLKSPADQMDDINWKVRLFRKSAGILPAVKQIDTLAAEYPAFTNYLYLTYGGKKHDVVFENDGKSVIVLGSGAYRMVNAVNTINKNNFRSVMINYNPETVSTDYDVTNRLYFDELSFERVMDIIR
jgi:carbamoyl-phosphate synthase large subunit